MYTINISEICEQTIQKLKDEKVIENLIAETVEDSVKEVTRGFFRGYDFRKKLEEEIGVRNTDLIRALGLNDFDKYVLKVIKKASIKETATEESIKSLFSKPIKEIKLSEILEKYKEHLEIYLDEEEKEDIDYNYSYNILNRTIRLKATEDESFTLIINNIFGTVTILKGEKHLYKEIFLEKYNSEFALFLLKLEMDNTKIIIDEEECKYCDTELTSEEEDYDY